MAITPEWKMSCGRESGLKNFISMDFGKDGKEVLYFNSKKNTASIECFNSLGRTTDPHKAIN